MLHVVLYQPEIPQNTGNIGRTCVAVGAKLWLVRPLGFHLDERHLRRAGMDYWQHLNWEAVESWQELQQKLPDKRFWYIDNPAPQTVWNVKFADEDVFVFGSESAGLPASITQAGQSQLLQLPMRSLVRSLNLASTVNTVVYEALRQTGFPCD